MTLSSQSNAGGGTTLGCQKCFAPKAVTEYLAGIYLCRSCSYQVNAVRDFLRFYGWDVALMEPGGSAPKSQVPEGSTSPSGLASSKPGKSSAKPGKTPEL